jgi:hypothetical protein
MLLPVGDDLWTIQNVGNSKFLGVSVWPSTDGASVVGTDHPTRWQLRGDHVTLHFLCVGLSPDRLRLLIIGLQHPRPRLPPDH